MPPDSANLAPRGAVERRAGIRLYATLRPAYAYRHTLAGPQPLDLLVLDLSSGGCLVASHQRVGRGSRLVLGFNLAGSGTGLTVPCDVRWKRRLEDGGPPVWLAGCEFAERDPINRDIITRFILEHGHRST